MRTLNIIAAVITMMVTYATLVYLLLTTVLLAFVAHSFLALLTLIVSLAFMNVVTHLMALYFNYINSK